MYTDYICMSYLPNASRNFTFIYTIQDILHLYITYTFYIYTSHIHFTFIYHIYTWPQDSTACAASNVNVTYEREICTHFTCIHHIYILHLYITYTHHLKTVLLAPRPISSSNTMSEVVMPARSKCNM